MKNRTLRAALLCANKGIERILLKSTILLTGIYLFSLPCKSQTYVPVTNTSGTATYSGISVSTTSSGSVTYASTCTITSHFQEFAGGSYTFTFSTPLSSVRIPFINSMGGSLTTAHFTVNGSPYALTSSNITGTNVQCGDMTINVISGGNLTNSGDIGGFPNSQIDIPGPVTSIKIQSISGSNVVAFQMLIPPCPPGSTPPAIVAMTGGGGYCPGGTGVNIGITGSAIGINYQLYRAGSPVGSPVAGIGYALNFGLQTVTGTYTATATNATTGCSSNMSGSETVATYPLPNVYNVTGGGSYCSGGSGVIIGVSSSDTGTSYKLYRGGLPVAGAIIPGTGVPINFPLQTVAGTYTVVAVMGGSTGCTNNMTGSATISANPLPAAYTVTGGGSYCSGGTGVHVGLPNSAIGVNYQLYRGAVAVGSPISGTGSSLDFGLQTTTGSYGVVATNTTTGCVNSMAGTVYVSINSLPTAFTVTGGGGYCAGGTGAPVGLSSSIYGVTYQLYNGGSPVGSPIAGTGAGISFGLQTAAGTYTVVATNTSTGCTNTMTGSVTITINPLPGAFAVTGGGSYCTGGTGTHVGLTGSNTGVYYQLYRGGSGVSSPMAGTGAALDFGSFTTASTYTAIAIAWGTWCVSNMTGSVTIATNPLPAAYTVTGGGAYCVGGTGVYIGLSNSQTGVTYQLNRGGTSIGSPVTGTGSAISFGLQTTAGSYTVIATSATTGCVNNMTGTVSVSVISTPTAYTVTGGGGYCSGSIGMPVYLSGSQVGVNYQLFNSGTPVGVPMAGTGAAISYGPFTTAGTYTVVGTTGTGGCTNNMTGSVTITIILLPNVYTITGGGSYCSGSPGVPVGLVASDAGITYQLYRGVTAIGSPVNGTGASISFGIQTVPGIYSVVAMDTATTCTNNMSGPVTISLITSPAIVSVTGGGGYCSGGAGVHVGLTGSAVGVNYQLYLGGSPVGSPVAGIGYLLDFGLQTATGIYTVTANNGCISTMAGSATVGIDPPPAISGTIYTVAPGASITLTGSISGGTWASSMPSYATVGTTSGVVTGVALGTTVITYTLTTGCFDTHTIATTATGFRQSQNNVIVTTTGTGNISVMPNPNTGTFTIRGSLISNEDQELTLEITNVVGQVIYSSKVTALKGVINELIKLNSTVANGMYLVSLKSDTEKIVLHIVITQ